MDEDKKQEMEKRENLISSLRRFIDDSGILTLRQGVNLNICFKDKKIKFVFSNNKIQLFIFVNEEEKALFAETTEISEIAVYKLLSEALVKFLRDIDNLTIVKT